MSAQAPEPDSKPAPAEGGQAVARKPGEVSIDAGQVRVGVYVRIPLGWLDHPFMSSNFLVTTEEQVREIQALGVGVFCNPSRSKEMPLPSATVLAAQAASAAENEERELQLTMLRQRQEAQRAAKAERARVMQQMRERLDASQKQYMAATEQAANAFKHFGAQPKASVEAMGAVANESARLLMGDPDSAIILIADKGRSQGEVMHALSVMTLSLLLAKQISNEPEVLRQVGLAALLHDIGMGSLNPSIVRNVARNRHEQAIYETHVKLGAEQLAAVPGLVPPAVLQGVLGHHESEDGRGYPRGLRGAEIPRVAKILAIANRFDNLTNPLDTRLAISPSEALGVMWARERAAFDEELLQTFIRTMGIYPPGTLVLLSDGRSGVVVAAAPQQARLCPQVLVYDPDTPRREAIILDLAEPELAQQLKVEKAVRMQDRSEDELDYLLPRRKVSWFRGSNG